MTIGSRLDYQPLFRETSRRSLGEARGPEGAAESSLPVIMILAYHVERIFTILITRMPRTRQEGRGKQYMCSR